MVNSIRYEGTVAGFLTYALPELRKVATRGDRLTSLRDTMKIQRELRKAEMKDLRDQILQRKSGGEVI